MKKTLKNLGVGLAMLIAFGLNAAEPVTAKVFNQLDKEINALIAKEKNGTISNDEGDKLEKHIDRLLKSTVYAPEGARLTHKWVKAMKSYQEDTIAKAANHSLKFLDVDVAYRKGSGQSLDDVKKVLKNFMTGETYATGLGALNTGFTEAEIDNAFRRAP